MTTAEVAKRIDAARELLAGASSLLQNVDADGDDMLDTLDDAAGDAASAIKALEKLSEDVYHDRSDEVTS